MKGLEKSNRTKKEMLPAGYLFDDRSLKRLIAPLIVEQILAVTVGMVDTMMVSSVGEAATSGVSLVDMINTLLINVFAAVATGGAVVASQYLGQRNKKKSCESALQLLIVTGIISLIIMVGSILFRKGLIHLLYGTLEENVLENALVYLVISAISYPFLAIYNSCAALFRSMGNSKISMQVSIIMNGINIAGDAILIFGFHMGVAGAAFASLLSRMVACVIAGVVLYGTRTASGKIWFRKIGHRLHFTKVLYEEIAACRFASGMALTLSSGLNPERSMELVTALNDDPVYRKKIETCREQTEEGKELSEALVSSGMFTGVYARMVSIGAKTGSMDQVMEEIADLYQDDIDTRMNNLLAVLEPTLVTVLSLIVGVILLSVMLPLIGIMSGI